MTEHPGAGYPSSGGQQPGDPRPGENRPSAPQPGEPRSGEPQPGGHLLGAPYGSSAYGGGAYASSAYGSPHDPQFADTEPLFPLPGDSLPGDTASAASAAEVPAQRRRRRGRWLAVPVAAALVGGGVGGWVGAEVAGSNGNTVVVGGSGSASTVQTSSRVPSSTTASVAASILPSVVSINVRGNSEADTGSGVIISADGYILTNNHVVAAASGGGSVSVTFNDGSSAPARIVGTDQPSDLAVIKVTKSGLTPAKFGDSSSVRVGDPVLAVGSPLGLSGTVTSGIVSALDRPVDTTSQQQTNPFDPFGGQGGSTSTLPTVIDAIQTDAAINPGNSGGPLVNMAGEVIGINSAIATVGSTGGQSGNIGVGFAIPISQAKVIASQLISTGHAKHPFLGVSITDATTSNGGTSIVVRDVRQGGPAGNAGVKVGDRIVAIDGKRVADSDSLIAEVRTHQPGDTVQLTVTRGGTQHTVSVKLGDAGASTG
jgi:putative serine protease PepD